MRIIDLSSSSLFSAAAGEEETLKPAEKLKRSWTRMVNIHPLPALVCRDDKGRRSLSSRVFN